MTCTTDLSKPSVNAARELARLHGLAHTRDAGRTDASANDKDKQAFEAEYARLLWCVSERDGGFMGIDDDGLEDRAAFYHIPFKTAALALWRRGEWPGEQGGRVAA